MTSSKDDFRIRKMTSLVDMAALRRIWVPCFAEEPSMKWYYHIPSHTDKDRRKNAAASQHGKEAYLNRMVLNPRVHVFFACDGKSQEDIIGMASWEAPYTSNATHLWRTLSTVERLWALAYRIWDFVMIPLAKRIVRVGTVLVKRERWADQQAAFKRNNVTRGDEERGYWQLDYMGVLPSHHRRGIGSQLIHWGLDQADREDRAVYLSASPTGTKLYAKHGFVAAESRVCFPGEECGGWTETYMRRPPKSEREKAAD